jgi:ribosomal protein S3AE
VREAIRNKRECYRNLGKCRSTENFEKYKVARREVKEAIKKTRSTVFKDLYNKLDTKDGKRIYIDLLVLGRRKLETLVW